MMSDEFLAASLSANQLLALLFICENNRKKTGIAPKDFTGASRTNWPKSWDEMISTFTPRLENLDEALRFEVIEAHLMSVEDIDIYNNDVLAQILRENSNWMNFLANDLSKEKNFQTKGQNNA